MSGWNPYVSPRDLAAGQGIRALDSEIEMRQVHLGKERFAQTIGGFYLAFGCVYIAGMVAGAVTFWATIEEKLYDNPSSQLFLIGIAAFFLVFPTILLQGGRKLLALDRQGKVWPILAALVVGASFPIGTALAVCTGIVLYHRAFSVLWTPEYEAVRHRTPLLDSNVPLIVALGTGTVLLGLTLAVAFLVTI